MEKETKFTKITSQAQCDRYKEIRESNGRSFSESSKKIYNALTLLIVDWVIRNDPDIEAAKKNMRPLKKAPTYKK